MLHFFYLPTLYSLQPCWHFNNVQTPYNTEGLSRLICTLDASATLCWAPCVCTSTYIYVCVSEEKDESKNESLLPDNSSLGSLSCCQPGEEQGWKSLQCSGNILYVSLTYQSMGQWAVASALHWSACVCGCVCVCVQIGGTSRCSSLLAVLVQSKKWVRATWKSKALLVRHNGEH